MQQAMLQDDLSILPADHKPRSRQTSPIGSAVARLVQIRSIFAGPPE
jgi:hypothetical protein